MILLRGAALSHIKAIAFSAERTLKGTKNATCKKFEDEGQARREEDPICVVMRVDNKRSYVYNIKAMTRTRAVPTEMAMATVRFLNGGEHEKQGTVGTSPEG